MPIASINQDEGDKLLRMEAELHRRVISQEKAISAISRAIRRSRAGLKNPNRPVGSFVFLGPTGVGKTELARALANFLFGSDHALIRFDMSEYMEKHSVSKLIGSPPGYVGHEEGGQLTEKVKRNPYSVVLLDEIEKAHPGHLQHPAAGVRRRPPHRRPRESCELQEHDHHHDVEHRRALHPEEELAGVPVVATPATIDKSVTDMVLGEVKRTFNPEFINRIDEIIVFEALTDDDLRRIMALLVDQLNANLVDRKLKIALTPEVDRLDHRGHLQGPLVRRAAAAPGHPALRRGSAVRGAHPRPPARRRDRGLPRGRAARLPAGRRARSRPEARLNRLTDLSQSD